MSFTKQRNAAEDRGCVCVSECVWDMGWRLCMAGVFRSLGVQAQGGCRGYQAGMHFEISGKAQSETDGL